MKTRLADESEMDMDEDPEFAYTINDCATPDYLNTKASGILSLEGLIYLN